MLDRIPIELMEAHGHQSALIAARRIGRPSSARLSVSRLMTVMPPSLRFAAAVAALAMLGACSDSATVVPRPPGGDFILQASDGPLDSRTLRGKVLLVYFGYVNCPDVCPVSIAAGAGALNALSPAERERTRMIMISVDPERDTPAALKTYVAYFHPQMVGAVGNASETAAVAKQFGAGYVRQPTRPDGSYAVDHSSQTYVVDRDGRLVEMLPLGTPTEKIASAVRKLL
jgi:protein SCO1/2